MKRHSVVLSSNCGSRGVRSQPDFVANLRHPDNVRQGPRYELHTVSAHFDCSPVRRCGQPTNLTCDEHRDTFPYRTNPEFFDPRTPFLRGAA